MNNKLILLLTVLSILFFFTASGIYAVDSNPIFLILGALGAVAFAVDNHHHNRRQSPKSVRFIHNLTDAYWHKKQIDFLLEEVRIFAVAILLAYLVEK